MTKFVAIQKDSSGSVTFAKLRKNGSLVIQARYYDSESGFSGLEEVDLFPETVDKLLTLLSVSRPTQRAADLPKALGAWWKCPQCSEWHYDVCHKEPASR